MPTPRTVSAPESVEFPFARQCPFSPSSTYSQLPEGPVARVILPDRSHAFLIHGYDAVRYVLAHSSLSSDRLHPALPLTEQVTPQARQAIGMVGKALVGLDPPEHGEHRRQLIPEFTNHRLQRLRPRIEQLADECITSMVEGPKPADLVDTVAVPLTSQVLCELLGIPYSDRPFFQHRALDQIRRHITPEARRQSAAELFAYIDNLVTDKEQDPPDDLIGRLIGRNRGDHVVFDHQKLVGLTMLLITAGFESTASMIALSVVDLLSHPDQLARLRDNHTTVRSAVEELLRHLSIVDSMPRVTIADLTVDGHTIPADSGVLVSYASANHDPSVFDDPSRLDLTRTALHHVAFGFGAHQCLGQNLARIQLEVALSKLLDRLPRLALAEPAEAMDFRTDSDPFGIDSLAVTW